MPQGGRGVFRNLRLFHGRPERASPEAKASPGVFRRLLGCRSGVSVAEFALVGPLFLLLTFAIVDNGLVLFTQTILDNATREAARQIRIGKVQLAGDTTGSGLFKSTLCNNLGGFIPCGNLQ